ncbi:MAG: hypothetical protein ACXW3O_02620 [Brevundimonas sp.]
MRPASILTTALLAAVGAMTVAGSAVAQTAGAPAGEARGLRYLSWSGRGPVAAAPAEASPARPAPARRDLRRPNTVIPHGGSSAAEAAASTRPGLTPAPGAGRTLTPANAWMQPRPAPTEAAPPPPAPAMAPFAAPSPPRMTPDYLPEQGGRGQPAPADLAWAAPPAPEAAADPMAPRRDAPIFRMQPSAPVAPAQPAADEPAPTAAAPPRRVAEVASTGERPPLSSARYYSVHRQNGRQPDALEMPAPTYIDALAVSMVETPASQDLAQPDQGPTLIRDAQGRVRPTPAASDGDHQ